MPKKKSLHWKLFQSHLLITVLSLSTIMAFTFITLRRDHIGRINETLRIRAELFAAVIPADVSIATAPRIDALADSLGILSATRFTTVLTDGHVVGDSEEDWRVMDNHGDRPEIIVAFAGGTGTSTRYSYTLEKYLMYVAVPVYRSGTIIAAVRTSMPVQRVFSTLHGDLANVALIVLIIGFLTIGVSFVVSSRIAKPIRQMTRRAEEYSAGNLLVRMPEGTTREISALGETLSVMAESLDQRIRAVTERRNELEALLSGMTEAVFSVDLNSRIVEFNRAAETLFRQRSERAAGRHIQEVIRNVPLQRFVSSTLAGDDLTEEEITIHEDGEQVLQAHGRRIGDASDRFIGAVIVLNDITRMKRLEAVRRDFVANVSHELKTPITSIMGFVETLRDGAVEDTENRHQFLGIIHRHVIRLNEIVDDLLSLSRIEQEAERGTIEVERAALCDLLTRAIGLCRTKADERHVTLALDCSPITLTCNPSLLEQAVMNLIDNAVKYSGDGAQVSVTAVERDGDIHVSVADTGPGIPRDQQERIFERFYRLDKGRSRALGGTGLGLSIVKHIVMAHHGHVTLDSTVGKGSTFTIHLPAA